MVRAYRRVVTRLLPPPGPLRTLAAATLANTVGGGLWLAGAALYLTRSVGLDPTSVGLGLTVAGLVGVTASVPSGRLADRRDPRTLRAALQVAQAVTAATYLLVDSFATFLLVAVVDALLMAGNLSVRAALVAAVGGPEGRVRAFATLHATASVGVGVGATLAAPALAADTRTGYVLLVLGNTLTYLLSAALLLRLPAFPPVAVPRRAARWPALRDRRFLAVSAASAGLALHETVLALVVPLWIVGHTAAPRPLVSVVLVLNTVLTVGLMVRLSARIGRAAQGAVALRRAGVVLAVAMLLWAGAAGVSTPVAVGLLLLAAAVHSVGEVWHANGATALAYDLARPDALGEYQGVAGLVRGTVQALGRVLLTVALLDGGWPGWLAVGAFFVVVGAAVPGLTRATLLDRPATVGDPS